MKYIIIGIILLLTPALVYTVGYFFGRGSGKGQMDAKSSFLKYELKRMFSTKGEKK